MLRRTNKDNRHAVLTLLGDDEWEHWSDREVARRCDVSDELVRGIRAADTSTIGSVRSYITKHGTVEGMNTAAIGRKG
jgi:hypothetical protein